MTTDAATLPVWTLAVRLGHGALATGVLGALLLFEGGAWHEALGYVALAVATWRVVYGWRTRDAYARFGAFVRAPADTWAYARALPRGQEPHHLGHNPLGGWMIVALLAAVLLAAGSGALYDTDRFWGDPVVYGAHQIAGWSLAVLVPLHLAGVVFTSLRQRENLVHAMLSGRKRAPPDGSVPTNSRH